MIIAVDFDGTCVAHDFPRVGPNIGAGEVLRDLVAEGHQIILNTIRGDADGKVFLSEAVMWFIKNDIPLYGVNVNPEQHKHTNSPKVHADLFIDDRGLGCPLVNNKKISKYPFVDWLEVRKQLYRTGYITRDY